MSTAVGRTERDEYVRGNDVHTGWAFKVIRRKRSRNIHPRRLVVHCLATNGLRTLRVCCVRLSYNDLIWSNSKCLFLFDGTPCRSVLRLCCVSHVFVIHLLKEGGERPRRTWRLNPLPKILRCLEKSVV